MSKKLFDDLRALAGETRNKKLAEVRAEYSQAIADIAAMEAKLIPKPVAVRPKSKRDLRLVDLIANVMPSDRIVTVDDVCGLLAAADPERQFNGPTIRATMHRLVTEGTIKKVSHPQADKKVGYCLPDFDAEEYRSLADWAEQVLSETSEPLTPVEIMVKMTEAGYEMASDPRKSTDSLQDSLRKSASVKVSPAGKWRIK